MNSAARQRLIGVSFAGRLVLFEYLQLTAWIEEIVRLREGVIHGDWLSI